MQESQQQTREAEAEAEADMDMERTSHSGAEGATGSAMPMLLVQSFGYGDDELQLLLGFAALHRALGYVELYLSL